MCVRVSVYVRVPPRMWIARVLCCLCAPLSVPICVPTSPPSLCFSQSHNVSSFSVQSGPATPRSPRSGPGYGFGKDSVVNVGAPSRIESEGDDTKSDKSQRRTPVQRPTQPVPAPGTGAHLYTSISVTEYFTGCLLGFLQLVALVALSRCQSCVAHRCDRSSSCQARPTHPRRAMVSPC